ncbi:superoxide dismutase family protein [Jeotgalicoccus halotolerans]|uniref:Cu-Zn family superoxide dismutase n=1 Tax=Jeotgalicoccus halotolerans TaxID=157227 RepID=A0A3E0AUL5_9STAP|nr:superoxide dismutase family protein [Jeotgalicoccus halotolerans]REG23456.1 Cu-Zn family superoxide dismutase [Jeotgalicoccus halotolerans]
MKRLMYLPMLLAILVLAACSDGEAPTQDPSEEIEVTMINGDEEEIGTATFSEADDGLTIALEAEGLETGMHGIHIHNAGMCEGPDFETAGDHYNPTDAAHGFDHEDGPHAGDLENIEVAEDGTVSTEIDAENVSILDENLDTTLLTEEGTALIIHSGEDDYMTQPSGDAGTPVACGVISEAK